jgi:hypothetical protein
MIMNQLTTQDQVKNLIQIRKSLSRGKAGSLADNKAFLDFLSIQQQMTAEFDKTWEVIRDQMEQYGITKIDGDWGHILIAERRNWVASDVVPPRFTKKVLDGSKIAAYFKLHNKVPTGISLTTTKYLTKKIKAI